MTEHIPIGADLDLLLDAARRVITRQIRVITAQNIQRRARVGFAKADRLLLLLAQEGIIARCDQHHGQWESQVQPDLLDAALLRLAKAANAE